MAFLDAHTRTLAWERKETGSHIPGNKGEYPPALHLEINPAETRLRNSTDSYVRLEEALLLRLNIGWSGSSFVGVFCSSREVGPTGLRIGLPSTLDLAVGRIVDMEVFLQESSSPVRVRGIVHGIGRCEGGDVSRYVVEVGFREISALAEREITAFLREAQTTECCRAGVA